MKVSLKGLILLCLEPCLETLDLLSMKRLCWPNTASHRSPLRERNPISSAPLNNITTTTHRQWEEVDHELAGPVAGSLGSAQSATTLEEDPLGLGRRIECVHIWFS